MNAKLKTVARRPADDWEEFRPEVVSHRRPSRSGTPRLLILSFLTAVFIMSWVFFKLPIRRTAAGIKRAIAELGQASVASTKPRPSTPAVVRKALRSSRAARGESPQYFAREPGPFEVYLLDGNRYIRVDARNRSVLLNMETGETTWVDADAASENSR